MTVTPKDEETVIISDELAEEIALSTKPTVRMSTEQLERLLGKELLIAELGDR